MDAPAHFVPFDAPSDASLPTERSPLPDADAFRLEVSDELLVDLHTRLFCTRFPNAVEPNSGDQDAGKPGGLAHLRGLVQTWFEDFDWRAAESRLNIVPHRFADLRGERIHFLYERSDREDAPHLVLIHDWPGSFHSLLPTLPFLREHFHVVVPALPGFAFSQSSPNGGLGIDSTAGIIHELVTHHLGVPRVLLHAGELGWGVAHRLALEHSEFLFGVHLVGDALREPEREAPSHALLYAMQDSPVGLAAWFLQELGEARSARLTRDELLTELMIYWTSGSIASAIRARRALAPTTGIALGARASVPTSISAAPAILRAARHRAKRDFTVVRASELDVNGAFLDARAAGALARDLHEFALEALPRDRRPGLKTARRVSSAPSAPSKTKPA